MTLLEATACAVLEAGCDGCDQVVVNDDAGTDDFTDAGSPDRPAGDARSGVLIYSAGGGIGSPALTVQDLDGDGKKELALSSLDGVVHLFTSDGTSLAGWPVPFPATEPAEATEFNRISRSAPAIGDLDGDGTDEIVVAGSQYLYAYALDGTVRWQSPVSPIFGNGILTSPVVADIDNDGNCEVILASNNVVEIFGADGNAYGAGWPKAYSTVFAAPAVADLDDDHDLEIVVSAVSQSAGHNVARHEVFHHDGSALAGSWPRTYNTDYDFVDIAPAVADTDGDGAPEIIAATYEQIFVYERTGETRAGWPHSVGRVAYLGVGDLNDDGLLEVATGWVALTGYLYRETGELLWENSSFLGLGSNSLTIGDISGDGVADCVIADGLDLLAPAQGWIRAFDSSGSEVTGMPPAFGALLRTSAALEDLDADGRLELVYAFADGSVRVFEPAVAYRAESMHWPQYRHDPQHTGRVPWTL